MKSIKFGLFQIFHKKNEKYDEAVIIGSDIGESGVEEVHWQTFGEVPGKGFREVLKRVPKTRNGVI